MKHQLLTTADKVSRFFRLGGKVEISGENDSETSREHFVTVSSHLRTSNGWGRQTYHLSILALETSLHDRLLAEGITKTIVDIIDGRANNIEPIGESPSRNNAPGSIFEDPQA